ncbi:MAG: methyltransferase domain-containing protein [Kofleriaceae bacterium]
MPQIHAVTLALLERLPALSAGSVVLDVACGTGEPGLTLARATPSVQVHGYDQAEALLAVAKRKAEREALANAQFTVASMHSLPRADASADAVISRFGLLMFGEVPAAARELARVLRPDAPFTIAVWDDPARNTLMSALLSILQPHLPKDRDSPMASLAEWAAEGRRARLLEELGLGPVQTEMFPWAYHFRTDDELWELVLSMDKFTGQATLSAEIQAEVRRELLTSLAAYRQVDGQWSIPHACRLLWGRRSDKMS